MHITHPPSFTITKFCSWYLYRLAQAVKLTFAFAIFITYALQAYVPVDIVWNTYLKKKVKKWDKVIMEYVIRISIVLLTCEYIINVSSFSSSSFFFLSSFLFFFFFFLFFFITSLSSCPKLGNKQLPLLVITQLGCFQTSAIFYRLTGLLMSWFCELFRSYANRLNRLMTPIGYIPLGM